MSDLALFVDPVMLPDVGVGNKREGDDSILVCSSVLTTLERSLHK